MGTLIHNNFKVSGDEGKAKNFAENLQKKFSEPSNTCFSDEHKKLIYNYFQNNGHKNNYALNQRNIKEFSVNKVLNKLYSKTSIDQDKISKKMLKHLTFIAKEKILTLFNACLKTQSFPDYWKVS